MKPLIKSKKLKNLQSLKCPTRTNLTRRIADLNKKLNKKISLNLEALKTIGAVVVVEVASSQLQMKLNSDN